MPWEGEGGVCQLRLKQGTLANLSKCTKILNFDRKMKLPQTVPGEFVGTQTQKVFGGRAGGPGGRSGRFRARRDALSGPKHSTNSSGKFHFWTNFHHFSRFRLASRDRTLAGLMTLRRL